MYMSMSYPYVVVAQNGWSALHWAADRNQPETVSVLLNGGIDPFLKGRVSQLMYRLTSLMQSNRACVVWAVTGL